ncbi:MAG: serine/threonine protein kinase [Xanthomonadales bacterium]|nr:serine/threonine protein kinase [Xanthomonadales bacterium]
MKPIDERAQLTEAELDDVLDLPPDQRARAIARVAVHDPAKAEALKRWLRAIDASDGLLDVASISRRNLIGGQTIGRWSVIREIATGGFAQVYEVERADHAYAQRGALKRQRADREGEDWRIAHERKLLARLDHPGIARLLDGGVAADGASYLVTEYVAGRALDDWLAACNPGSAERIAVMLQLVDAVAAAHAQGVAHGDLKPGNILVDGQRARMIDFGASRLTGPAVAGGEIRDPSLTPRYAAPERLRGAPSDAAADQFSLGLLLHLLLAGALPAARRAATLDELTADTQPPVVDLASVRTTGVRHGLRDLEAILQRCLQPDPLQRHPSVTALQADLLQWQRHRPIAARHWSAMERLQQIAADSPRTTGLLALLALAALLLALDDLRLRGVFDATLR